MARTVWPLSLNTVALSTSAGRRFTSALSVHGKGTITTSHGSQITKCLVVLWRVPLVERGRKRLMKCDIKRLDPFENYCTFLYFISDQIPRFQRKKLLYFFRNSNLSLGGKLAEMHGRNPFC